MLNHLNSIIIEGDVVEAPESSSETSCWFQITSKRYCKSENGIEEGLSFFEIEASGNLGKTCAKILKKGRGVRVVGRLKQVLEDFEGKSISRIIIVAEHVEVKPEKKD